MLVCVCFKVSQFYDITQLWTTSSLDNLCILTKAMISLVLQVVRQGVAIHQSYQNHYSSSRLEGCRFIILAGVSYYPHWH